MANFVTFRGGAGHLPPLPVFTKGLRRATFSLVKPRVHQDISQRRRALSRLGTLAATGVSLAGGSLAHAQDGAAPARSEIVVQAKRYGEADMPSEAEIDEQTIQEYGASSINELLGIIAPMIDGSNERPEFLVNGKRVGDGRNVAGYPPEALQRVEVLPKDAAGQYGVSGDKRVVNLVLKKQFRMVSAASTLSFPFQGGQDGEQLNGQFLSIEGDTRWNVGMVLSRQSRLLESTRDVSPPPGNYSVAGNVIAQGAELDPWLSDLAGFPVRQAAVPPDPTGSLTVEDFLSGAGQLASRDDGAFRSLQPSTRSIQVNAGMSRPVGAFSLTLAAQAGLQSSRRLLGLAEASVMLPAGTPFSPFANDVLLQRLLPGYGPLAGTQNSSNISLSSSVAYDLGKHHILLSLSYDNREATGETDRGLDLSAFQDAVLQGDPAVNPFVDLPGGDPLTDTTHSISNSWQARLSVNGPVIRLPAGATRLAIDGGYQASSSTSTFTGRNAQNSHRASSTRGNGGATLSLPLASAREDFLGALGEVRLELSGGFATEPGGSVQTRYGGAVNWRPVAGLSFAASMSQAAGAPTSEQTDAPRIDTPGIRFYDYTSGELAEITQVTGGNPDLRGGKRVDLSLGADFRPSGFMGPMLALTYFRSRSSDGIGSLPSLTPAVEAAFPDRVVRDSEGHLVQVDLRPINLASERSESLRTLVGWGFPIGKAPAAPQPESGPAQGSKGNHRGWAAQRGRVQFTLSHNWQLSNELLIRAGLPVLDRLAGQGGGQSRHTVQFMGMAALDGSSVALMLNWASGYKTVLSDGAAQGGGQDLNYAPSLRLNLKFDFDLGKLALLGRPKWLKGTRLGVDVDNLLDSRQHVTRDDGTVPSGYLRDDLDPLGRSLRIELRQTF